MSKKKRFGVWFSASHTWLGGYIEAETKQEAEDRFYQDGGGDDALDEVVGGIDTPTWCHQCPDLGDPSDPVFEEDA